MDLTFGNFEGRIARDGLRGLLEVKDQYLLRRMRGALDLGRLRALVQATPGDRRTNYDADEVITIGTRGQALTASVETIAGRALSYDYRLQGEGLARREELVITEGDQKVMFVSTVDGLSISLARNRKSANFFGRVLLQ